MSRLLQFVAITVSTRIEVGEFFQGEIRCVPQEVADELIGNEWAETTEVEIPLSEDEVPPESVTLEVQNAGMSNKTQEAG